MIVNLISGPRNISTALMYAFAQHSGVRVVDEPFYAYYLAKTKIDHPGGAEILASMDHDEQTICSTIHQLEEHHKIVFLKNMAHHHLGLQWTYLKEMKNVFLIRDPKQLITSFAQVIPHPTLQDIGLKYEADLLDYVNKNGAHKPIVIDSNDILKDPETGLSNVCEQLDIPFEESMLSWNKGGISEDGSWAKYWYKNVHNSNGFAKQKTSERQLPSHCEALLAEALPYYEKLKKFIH